jgi:hypothetical protein
MKLSTVKYGPRVESLRKAKERERRAKWREYFDDLAVLRTALVGAKSRKPDTAAS